MATSSISILSTEEELSFFVTNDDCKYVCNQNTTVCMFIYYNLFTQVAVVGLSHTMYSTMEEDLMVEVLIVVKSVSDPNENCPVALSFAVRLSTLDGSAGK